MDFIKQQFINEGATEEKLKAPFIRVVRFKTTGKWIDTIFLPINVNINNYNVRINLKEAITEQYKLEDDYLLIEGYGIQVFFNYLII